MNWSVRSCVECGEYKYVEDGVCQDCQMNTYDVSKLREIADEEDLRPVPSIATDIIRELRKSEDEDDIADVDMDAEERMRTKHREFEGKTGFGKRRLQIKKSTYEAKRIIKSGHTVLDTVTNTRYEVLETHSKDDYFVAEDIDEVKKSTQRFMYSVFVDSDISSDVFELIGGDDARDDEC